MEQADIAEELLKKLKITQVHLLSHDYGDTVALELLARFDSLSRTQKCWSNLSYGMYLYSIGFLCWVNETEQNRKPWSYDWKSWYMYVKKTMPDCLIARQLIHFLFRFNQKTTNLKILSLCLSNGGKTTH